MTKQHTARWVNIDAIQAWDKNPRNNEHAVQSVADSIERFGWGSPIIARKSDGVVIAGHTRLKAAQRLKMDKVLVRYLDLDPAEAAALALADNKIGELADWDDEGLRAVLLELDAEDVNLDGLGFSDEELNSFLDIVEPDFAEDSGLDLEVDDTVIHSRIGEVYDLGDHRLACGDSTDPSVWKLVLQDESAEMIWTDPPYGVSYVGKTADALTIQNDELCNDDLGAFLGKVFDAALGHSIPGCAVYVAAPPGPKGIPFAVELHQRDMFRQRLVWVKQTLVLGHSDYHYKHEDIYFGYTPGYEGRRGRGSVGWYSDNSQTSVLEFDRPTASREHPTMKPLDLISYCIQNSSMRDAVVFDPFGGSGSTMMAAAMTGRRARLIELDPKYCDVIRRRWTRYARANNIDPGPGALDPLDGE